MLTQFRNVDPPFIDRASAHYLCPEFQALCCSLAYKNENSLNNHFNSLTISLQKDLREIYQKKKKKRKERKSKNSALEKLSNYFIEIEFHEKSWKIEEEPGNARW